MVSLPVHDTSSVRPLHVVAFCILVMTLAGGFLLLSPARPTAPVDGAIAWTEESPLRAVVQLLCLNYQVPTIHAGAVKNYILGLGAGLVILALTISTVATARRREEAAGDGSEVEGQVAPTEAVGALERVKTPLAPLVAAQALFALYVLWSFASTRWSVAPDLAVGGSILLAIQFLWALGIGHGLGSMAARLASRLFVGVVALTAVVAIWYHYGRNPTLRADFPLGNPSFLAACLTPGILLGGCFICERLFGSRAGGGSRALWPLVPAAAAVGLAAWAFRLADSRGPGVGLVFGTLGAVFFALRGRRKWIPVALALGIGVAGWFYVGSMSDAFSPTGRSATVRLRGYAWRYAWQMFNENPVTGAGQGGFALAGDSHAIDDVLADPLVFASRIAHVHNEWLEVMADLGAVGIVLLGAALLLTLRAGMGALATPLSQGHRWMLVGLLGSLVGLIVEQCFGVGLRVSGVVTCFYTVLGLTWALSRTAVPKPPRLCATPLGRTVLGAGGVLLGVGILTVTHQDFAAARSVYRAREALERGDAEEAIRLASRAADRLSPQRSLTNLYRLGQAHLQAARALQQRAADRVQRAQEIEPPNLRLLALAEEDYRLSDEHCKRGSGALNELVERSPGFINHGWLGCWLNLTRAGNAAARGDSGAREALLQDAAVAISRELRRQPFVPEIAADYVRVQRSLEEPASSFGSWMDVLARPLRHNRITGVYVDLVAELADDPAFDEQFEEVLEQAIRALSAPPLDERTGMPWETWAPEKLRLEATVCFLRGDYRRAAAALELAAPAYDSLSAVAPLGAASCRAELADCRFFSDPNDAGSAIAAAELALVLAPQSRPGRLLVSSVRARMIDYALAAGREDLARTFVRETSLGASDEATIDRALGSRYARMTESLLNRRDAGGVLRKPPAHLVPRFRQWLDRAIELSPDEPLAYYLAADLAFYVGDDQITVTYLREALVRGLSPETAAQFLHTALDRMPSSEPLRALWNTLEAGSAASDRPRRPGADLEGPVPGPPG
jgi:O-antigen ligase/tetratricopeptide (TPR) repeat protein